VVAAGVNLLTGIFVGILVSHAFATRTEVG
jgi:hypothetical protein